MKDTLGKKLHQIGELDLEPSIVKVLSDILAISELALELSTVYISQVNRPHSIFSKSNLLLDCVLFGPEYS